ncbi:hypothetical protein [Streptomyces sp. NPDC051662]|uniref:hypothetical protein n=1 Tax=Streptomyces sp. NPDC051662 TaxID=3154750 RepID=UPI00344AD127
MTLGLTKEEEAGAFEGVMPWLRATGEIAELVKAELDRPLAAAVGSTEHDLFDADSYYDEERRTPLEKKIAALAARPMWRMERVWLPDSETDPEETEAYDQACVEIDGRLLHLRCLDAYTELAYSTAGLHEGEDFAQDGVPGDLLEALDWAEAGVWLIQQSLPFPFRDVLQYGAIDNRPAIRMVFAYATLLRAKSPRKATPWFRALVYMDPEDRIGARYFVPGGTHKQRSR